MNIVLWSSISSSLEKHVLSKNLLALSLASLSRLIADPNTVNQLELQTLRRSIAQIGTTRSLISIEELQRTLPYVSPEAYMDEDTLFKVWKMCNDGDFQYVPDFIPDTYVFSDTYYQEMLIEYVEKEIMNHVLDETMRKRLLELHTKEYSYVVILKAFQWNKSEILADSRSRTYSLTHRLGYILGIVKNKLPETRSRIAIQFNNDYSMLNLDFSYLFRPQSPYQQHSSQKSFEAFQHPIFNYDE